METISRMDSSGGPHYPGEAVTPKELYRVALTVALAISNPRMYPLLCSRHPSNNMAQMKLSGT
jgi:hypothetical protein